MQEKIDSLQLTTPCGESSEGSFTPRPGEEKHYRRHHSIFLFKKNLKPLLFTLFLCTMMSLAGDLAFAQQQGGQVIFGQNETMIPNAVRNFVIFLFGITFLIGAGGACWGTVCYMRRQECQNWLIGGGLCMVVGGVIAGIAYLAGGNALQVNQDISFVTQTLTSVLT